MRTGIFRGSLLVLLLAAAGCGGAGSPASVTLPPLPSHTAAASSSGTQTPSPSSSTASATSPAASAVRAGPPPKVPETKAGAELFIRDFYATLNDAIHSGDTGVVRRYYDAGCQCLGLADTIDHYTSLHERVTGPAYLLEAVAVGTVGHGQTALTVTYSIHHLKIIDAQGHLVETTTDDFSHRPQSYFLAYGGDSWRIIDTKRF